MEINLNRLKQKAKWCLQNITPIISNKAKNKSRFVTYDLNTVILDLIQCIENTTQKREKRYKRIQFLIKTCGDTNINCKITKSTYEKLKNIEKILYNNSNTISLFNIFNIFTFKIEQDTEIQPSIYLLKLENKIDIEDDTTLFFKKYDKNTLFLPPEKQEFNNHCKTILNNDGYVYDIFSYVAIIMFYELINDINNDIYKELHKKILNSCYLVFKGGASIGKHIIQNDKNIWSKTTQDQRIYILNDFIKGGDNDTSIHINKVEFVDYTYEEINKALSDIMLQLPIYMNKILIEFDIQSLIQKNINDINETIFEYANTDFKFINRESTSYAIVDDEEDNTLIRKKNYNISKSQIYNTMSYVEFYDSKKNINKFYLARIKCAIKSEPIYDDKDLTINCYAECLDVSCPCIDSAELLEYTNYIDITDQHILFNN
jgi:hypothetical protein